LGGRKTKGLTFIFGRIRNKGFSEPQNAQDAKLPVPVIFMFGLNIAGKKPYEHEKVVTINSKCLYHSIVISIINRQKHG
jgi:hypothetical protein